MGYFDTVDIELFSIFNRESRNAYYDAIKAIRDHIEYETRYDFSITKKEAKFVVQNMLERHEEYTIKDERQMTESEIGSYAANILRVLVDHKWLSEKMAIIEEEDYFVFSKKADILYQAMEKMAKPISTYEYTNAVVNVCNACESYNDGRIPQKDIYLKVLKLAYDTTQTLKTELFGESDELINLIKDISKHKTAKDLVNYMLDVVYGKEFSNFYRLISSKNEFIIQKQVIENAIDRIAVRDYDYIVASYKELNNIEDGYEDEIQEKIDRMINDLKNFYERDYDSMTTALNETITRWFKKAEARLRLLDDNSIENEASSMLMRLLMKQVKENYDGDCDESVTKLLNLYDTKVFTDDSLYRIRQTKASETKVDEIKEEAVFDIDEALDILNQNSDRNMKNTVKYLENLFGDKKIIEANEFDIRSKEQYSKLVDIIKYAMSDNFAYEIEIDFGNRIKYENAEFTNFRLIRKENV